MILEKKVGESLEGEDNTVKADGRVSALHGEGRKSRSFQKSKPRVFLVLLCLGLGLGVLGGGSIHPEPNGMKNVQRVYA